MQAVRVPRAVATARHSRQAARPVSLRRPGRTNAPVRASMQDMMLTLAAAQPGDVDAPIGVIVGAAIVVTLVATAAIPLALKPGSDAANRLFAETKKGTDPLAKRASAKKAPAKKR